MTDSYETARAQYAELGVDTDQALRSLSAVPVSLHCWQGDDVRGFEESGTALSGGLQVTGSYPGRARNPDELRQDMEQAMALIPGRSRVNLHAMYGEFPGRVDRDAIAPEHYSGWIAWAREHGLGLDFNATLFAHPRADTGFTLSSPDSGVRRFWIEHVKRCRRVTAAIGKELGSPCIHNLWIPDGMKDTCVDKAGYRHRLREALDEIYAEELERALMKDSLEGKLFGIGSESFVVGSHEFYLSYALKRGLILCLDLGHFHPTESVADKLSALLEFMPELLLHVSRGVRWDSDHVVVLDDALREVCREVVRGDALTRVHLALDYFDASINRVAAWVIGARAVRKALLGALLEPRSRLVAAERGGDYFVRLALLEQVKTMPLAAVWDEYCRRSEVPLDREWPEKVRRYEQTALRKRV
jgi:L-rhamnose isomerase